MSVSAAITPGSRNNTDSLTLFNPLFWCERKAVQTSHDFNPVEFDGIKITVVVKRNILSIWPCSSLKVNAKAKEQNDMYSKWQIPIHVNALMYKKLPFSLQM